MFNQQNSYEFIKFKDEDLILDVRVDYDNQTTWLSRKEMALLYGVSIDTISLHINNILKEGVLDASTAEESSVVQLEGNNYKKRKIKLYNLDMITMVGYRIKSTRTAKFKEWCESLFSNKDYDLEFNNMPIYSDKTCELVEFKEGDFSLTVNVTPDEDTVWLSQNDIALLFETTRQNIGLHVKNILAEDELDNSVCKFFFHTAQDGKVYKIMMYNLDMIIAVGYRVNSKRGTIFRKWATSILKQYLLTGHVINEDRCLSCASNIISIHNKMEMFENRLDSIENKVNVANTKLFYEGDILDPYTFIRKLFHLAKNELIVVDYYADQFLLSMLSDIKVNITIITSTSSYLNNKDIPSNIRIIQNNNIHGRYIFIDDTGYIIDNSFNNLGNKRTLMMKLEDNKELILKGII